MNDISEYKIASPQNSGSRKLDPEILRELNKHEMILLIYRVTAILIGMLILFLGYQLFTTSVIDPDNIKNYSFELQRILPGLVLACFGLLLIVMGITRLMPLPKMDNPYRKKKSGKASLENLPEDGIPVLTQDEFRPKEDLLWKNNVKPLLVKVASNEKLSHSDRDLLRKWLHTMEVH